VYLFEARETDPMMEASHLIWETFGDFTDKAEDMERTARALSRTLASQDDVTAAVRALGATCTACHDIYSEEN
jgi:cytochrome c556